MFDVIEYQSAEEMIAAHAERRARMNRPTKTVIDRGINLSRPRAQKSSTVFHERPHTSCPSVGNLWTTPSCPEMAKTVEAPEGAWRRFVDGAALVLIDGRERFCPAISIQHTSIFTEAVETGVMSPPSLPDGSIPRTNKELLKAVAFKHGMSMIEMMSDRRTHSIVVARHEAMWWFRKLSPFSLPHIGQIMGGRDHTTVMHGVRAHQARLDAGEAV